jgi:hypothetical protein
MKTLRIVLAEDRETLDMPSIGGWVMHPDGATLIVFRPDQAKLVFIDTIAGRELKRIEPPTRPDILAVQGKRLFVATQEASTVHVVDLDSGKSLKEIKMPGGVLDLVCHPKKGLLYAVTSKSDSIVTIDPEAGSSSVLEVSDGFLEKILKARNIPAIRARRFKCLLVSVAVDPNNADTFYAVCKLVQIARVSVLAKCTIKGKTIEAIAVNQSAAQPSTLLPLPLLRVSGDGKKVGVAGQKISLLAADDVSTPAGTVGGEATGNPRDLAFHPVLNLGATEMNGASFGGGGRWGTRLHLFNSKTLVEITTFDLTPGTTPQKPSRLLTFGARGTKLLYHDSTKGQLRLIPLALSNSDRTALTKFYAGKRK